MTTVRSSGVVSATLLQNGQVLVAGGNNGSTYLASAELYNPATGTWRATGSMTTVRSEGVYTATALQDGEVLIAGGANSSSSSSALASAELYNPATGTFTATGSMTTAGEGQTATLLQNGEVLVADELYNPATGKWTATAAVGGPFGNAPQAVLLANGDVFVVGGEGITELYNRATGSWSRGARFDDRNGFSVTLLDTGKVLVAGGLTYSPRPTHTTSSALLYDPTTGTWQNTGAMNTSRYMQNAVLLQSGQVLVAGGNHIGSPSKGLTSAELYQL
jgi:N-acetylneuraminic acid mutarotase